MMNTIRYSRGTQESSEIENDLISFVYDLPTLHEVGIFPPFQVLNRIFQAGECIGSGTTAERWSPFSITKEEFDELVWQIKSIEPQILSPQARFTHRPFEFDYQLNNFNDPQAWLEAARAKHGVKRTVEKPSRICFYSVADDWGFFSNFALYPIQLKGKTWPTPEHFFQAQKFTDPGVREKIRKASTPMEAAILGRSRKVKLRKDWDSVKIEVMAEALYAKFTQHDDLKTQLLATGSAILVEHTDQDHFWGDGKNGKGRNMLGKLLMNLREKLKSESSS